MTLDEAIQEFEFDCKIRHLSPKTIDNYKKQLRYKVSPWRRVKRDYKKIQRLTDPGSASTFRRSSQPAQRRTGRRAFRER